MTDTTTAPADRAPAGSTDADPRPLFARAAALTTSVLAVVRPDQRSLPTPCGEMDVARLQNHLVMVAQRVACAGRGDDPMTWPGESEWSTGPEALDAWELAVAEAQEAWADDTLLDRVTELPWGTFTGRLTLSTYVSEVTVHTWDLARAIGVSPDWDAEVVDAALAAMREQLPLADRTPIWEAAKATMPPGVPWQDPFADATPIADDAPAIDRLIAWVGRRP